MRLMHFADLHLDSPFQGLEKQYPQLQQALIQSPYQAFEQGITIAIKEAVDVVVIVGDIYNTQRQTIYAQHFFIQQLVRLESADIPVIICHGNHDYLENKRMLTQYPSNVFVFKDEEVDSVDLEFSDQTSARFYGFSYTRRWIQERKIQEFPNKNNQTTYTIGLLHGAAEAFESKSGNYAPFSTQELIEKNYDYWALGHIHQNQKLNEFPLIRYAGTPQGRHRLETGDKGAYIITFEPNQPLKEQFVSLAQVLWVQETIDCQYEWQANEVVEAVKIMLDNYHTEVKNGLPSQILSVTLTNAQRLPVELQNQIEAGELDLLFPEPASNKKFVAIISLKLERKMVLQAFEYDQKLKQSFQEAADLVSQGEAYYEILEDFFTHTIVRKWLPDLVTDEEFKNEILQSAKESMIQAIGFELKEAGPHED